MEFDKLKYPTLDKLSTVHDEKLSLLNFLDFDLFQGLSQHKQRRTPLFILERFDPEKPQKLKQLRDFSLNKYGVRK